MDKEGLLTEKENDSNLEEAKKAVSRRQQGYPSSIRKKEELPYHCFREVVPEGSRRKPRKSRILKANEKVEIVYKVLVLKEH